MMIRKFYIAYKRRPFTKVTPSKTVYVELSDGWRFQPDAPFKTQRLAESRLRSHRKLYPWFYFKIIRAFEDGTDIEDIE